jgi:acetyltransferase-like isoleucine patch superfamily enzyme
VTIEDDVWIGSNCVILPGVKLGCGCVIGAGSVVTENIPPNAIAVGVPARVFKYRNVNMTDEVRR